MNISVNTLNAEDSSSLKQHVLAEKTSQIYDASNKAIIASVINSIILVIVFWPVVQHFLLLSWFTALVSVSVLRRVLSYRYINSSNRTKDASVWAHRFLIGSVAASLLWGATTVWIFPVQDLARQVFLAFVIGGMAAAAITTLSYLKLAIYAFLLLSLLPLMIRFFISGTELSLAMASMIALYLVVLLQSAKQTYIKNHESICMRIENQQQQKSLSESENRYETLLNTATDAFFLHDLKGKILDVNKQACLSLGYTKDELLTMSVSDIDVETGKPDIKWEKLKEGENISVESMHRCKDGSTFPVEVGIGYIHMGDEALVSVLARDITERKRIEKMKNEFVSTVSHELRTPLTSIRGSLGLIAGGAVGVLPPKAKEILNIASNNTERLLLLINDILDMQKIETGELEMEFEKLDVISFLEKAIKDNLAYVEQFKVSILFEPTVKNVFVKANNDRLMQVMANLLSNAAKFSHKNGTIEVSAVKQKDSLVCVSVTDYGQGIAKEFYPTIFDKFTQQDSSDTRQKGGTGLGLNITRAIIEKHGGKIGFTSDENVRTTFYFELPEYIDNKV